MSTTHSRPQTPRDRRAGNALLVVLLLGWGALANLHAAPAPAPPSSRRLGLRVIRAQKHDLSPPLSRLAPAAALPPPAGSTEQSPNLVLPGRKAAVAGVKQRDPRYSAAPALAGPMPAPGVAFEGVASHGLVPPDTNGAVGPAHYVQWVNLYLAVWDKSGNLLYGPVPGNTLWSGFGGVCEAQNNGDPIVLYDHLADRWLMSQLAFQWPHNFHQCIAVSQTGSPTGAWYRYDFFYDNDILNDYPKFAAWPDAYYMAVNRFVASTNEFKGQGAVAFERDKMLAGLDARMIAFDLYAVNPNFAGQLPADLDGPLPPPPGAPCYFAEVDDDAWGWPSDRLQLWKFHVDWTDTSRATFGVNGEPDAVIDLAAVGYAFDADMCGYARCCIPQPGGNHVDAISDRLMWRLTYRNFGAYEALAVNHTVDVDGADHAGVRWYEVRDPAGSPFVFQGGTFAPDGDNRWMGSLAMDALGDIAVGYSVSSATTYPSIRYAGRLASDPPGTLPRTEATLMTGSGYQVNACRWGDYSAMTVDPTDDCTFWFTDEYYTTTDSYTWQTRIGAFRFDDCGHCPLLGTPSLTIVKAPPGVHLAWSAAPNASVFDVVEGDLSALASSAGDFSAAVRQCLADHSPASSLPVDEPDPAPGNGLFYLVRGVRNGCVGTYDAPGGGQARPRDAGIGAAPGSCP